MIYTIEARYLSRMVAPIIHVIRLVNDVPQLICVLLKGAA